MAGIEKGLTPKQEKFCQEYVRCSNASEAYRLAYATKGKPEAIHVRASELMADRKVAVRIKAIRESVAEKSELESAQVLNEIRRLCAVDPRRLMHEDGRIKMPHELDDDTAAAIASFEIDLDGGIKYKFWDKNSALERASKILGLFEKDNSQKTDPVNALTAAVLGGVVGVMRDHDQEGDDE